MPATIKLIFFGNINNSILGFQLSFQKGTQLIKDETIILNIPDYIFKHRKDKAVINIKLFGANFDENKEHKFYVYYGENKAYVQLKYLNDKSYEIIFKTRDNIKLSLMEKDFTELDTMGNNRLKRLVLINYSDINLFINNKGYDLSEIILKDCNKMANSYQLSELNYEMKEFIVKPIVDIKEFDIEFFRKNKDVLLKKI